MCVYGIDSSGGCVSNLISQSYYQSQPPACILGMMTVPQISFLEKKMQVQFMIEMPFFNYHKYMYKSYMKISVISNPSNPT